MHIFATEGKDSLSVTISMLSKIAQRGFQKRSVTGVHFLHVQSSGSPSLALAKAMGQHGFFGGKMYLIKTVRFLRPS